MNKLANSKSIRAIFGGTFDPPHIGHLKPLQQVLDMFDLQHMYLMPASQPALKGKVTAVEHRLEMTKLLCELDDRLIVDTTEIENGGKTYTVETLAQLKQQTPQQTLMFVIGLDSLRNIEKWYHYESLFKYAHIVVMCRDLEFPKINCEHQTEQETAKQYDNTKLAPYLYNSKMYKYYTSERQFDILVGPEMDESVRSLLQSKLALNESNLRGINYTAIKDIIVNSVEGKLWFVNNNLVPISSTEIRQLINQGEDVSKHLPKSILNYIQEHNLYK